MRLMNMKREHLGCVITLFLFVVCHYIHVSKKYPVVDNWLYIQPGNRLTLLLTIRLATPPPHSKSWIKTCSIEGHPRDKQPRFSNRLRNKKNGDLIWLPQTDGQDGSLFS